MTDRRAIKKVETTKQRTKRRHDGSSSFQPESDVEEAPNMTFRYLFQNDQVEHAWFVKSFISHPIFDLKSLDSAFFIMEGFHIVTLLGQTHLLVLAKMECSYSKVMVKVFYQNLHYSRGKLTSRVCEIDIVMTALDWTELLGFNFDALPDATMYDRDFYAIFDGYDREAIIVETQRADAEPGQFAQYPLSNLFVPTCILHYVMTHTLFQRPHNHGKVLEGDFVILWAILHQIKVN